MSPARPLLPHGRAEWLAWSFEAIRAAAFAVAIVWTLAALGGLLLHRAIPIPVVLAWGVVIALGFAGRRWRGRPDVRPRPWVGWVLAFVLFAGVAGSGMADVERLEDWHEEVGLWLMRPGSRIQEQSGTRPKVEYAFDDWGLRGTPGRRSAPGKRSVIVVGDSRPFSAGVAAGDTFPERVEESLRDPHGLAVDVFNFSMAGCGPDTYSRLIRYARGLMDVDTVVVYLVDHHVDVDNDVQVRLRRVADSFGYRLLLAMRLEDLVELVRQLAFPPSRDLPRMKTRFVEALDRIASSSEGVKNLLVVPELHDDFAAWYQEWAARNPGVATFDVAGLSEWVQAPTFHETGDDHWTIEGTKVVARILADRLAVLWSTAPAPQ